MRVLARAQQRADRRVQARTLLLRSDLGGQPACLLAQRAQLGLASVDEDRLQLLLELGGAQGTADARARTRGAHVLQEPPRPGAEAPGK
jgi:hypothetical protein